MKERNSCTILILAAGQSARMGKPKQLLPWKDATLIEHAIAQAKQSQADNIILLLGAHRNIILPLISIIEGIDFVVNENWKNGILNTIQRGITACENSTDSILIMLGDQPAVNFDYIDKLLEKFELSGKSIIATEYNLKIGVPAIFSKVHFKGLKELTSNNGGAQDYIKKNSNKTLIIQPPFKLYDIDTFEDYEFHYINNH